MMENHFVADSSSSHQHYFDGMSVFLLSSVMECSYCNNTWAVSFILVWITYNVISNIINRCHCRWATNYIELIKQCCPSEASNEGAAADLAITDSCCIADWICPRRRRRFRKCARRRRKNNGCPEPPNEDNHSSSSPSSYSPSSTSSSCWLQQHCKIASETFCRMYLPPPLPYSRRKKATICHELLHASQHNPEGSGTDERHLDRYEKLTPTNLNPSKDTTIQESFVTTQTELSALGNMVVSMIDDYSSSSSSCLSVEEVQKSPRTKERRKYPPIFLPESTLLDLVRMQQWNAILSHPYAGSLLRRRNAKVRDADGLYPLHWACSGGPPVTVIQALLEIYPSAARKDDKEGSTPLHYACHYSATLPVVEALLSVYPKAAHLQDRYGRTPLYHSVEKSANLSILKALIKVNPGAITTPCLPTHLRGEAPDCPTSLLGGGDMARALALRTPLFQIWAEVIADSHTKAAYRGKKWDKASLMLLEACAYHHSELKSDDPVECQLLSASILMDLYLPEKVVPWLVHYFSNRNFDGYHALQCAASVQHYSSQRSRQIISILLKEFPPAKESSAALKPTPLSLALVSGKCWSLDGVKEIFEAAPDHLFLPDLKTKLPPVLLAAMLKPELPSHRLSADSVLKISHWLQRNDPYRLLATEPRNIFRKEQSLDKPCFNDSTADLEFVGGPATTRLETVFELLRADPLALQLFRSGVRFENLMS